MKNHKILKDLGIKKQYLRWPNYPGVGGTNPDAGVIISVFSIIIIFRIIPMVDEFLCQIFVTYNFLTIATKQKVFKRYLF